MLRLLFLFLLCACICLAIKAENTTTPTPTPASPESELKNAPTPSRETLASAPAGYLDLPQKAKIGYSSVHVDGPYIAMTFDDGPSLANTPRLLDMLAQRHIKATFFLIGQNIVGSESDREKLTALVKRIHAEGHEIGNHSWTHPVLSKMPDDAVRAELQKTQDAIVAAIGMKPTLMRPPYGAITKEQKDWIHKEFGYEIILWDVDPNDWKIIKGESAAQRTARVENVILNGDKDGPGAHSGSIILSHDIHATTVDAMPDTLDKLLAKGFKFVTVSQLIAMEKPVPPKTAASPATHAGTQAASGTSAPGQ